MRVQYVIERNSIQAGLEHACHTFICRGRAINSENETSLPRPDQHSRFKEGVYLCCFFSHLCATTFRLASRAPSIPPLTSSGVT